MACYSLRNIIALGLGMAPVILGTLTGLDGNPLTIDGLWGLDFGNNGAAGSANTLFFTPGRTAR
jgi:hypothetical protein